MRSKPPVALPALLLAGMLSLGTAARAAAAPSSPEDHWAPTRQWMSFRVGSAKISGDAAPKGGVGAGIEYSRMLSQLKLYKWSLFKRWAIGGSVSYENVGSFADAAEIQVPATLTLIRHFRASPSLHLYGGFGGGAYYRKLYRTGDDMSVVRPGFLVNAGVNIPIDSRQLVGLDWRVNFYDGTNGGDNPVFGPGQVSATMWSLKLNYILTYF